MQVSEIMTRNPDTCTPDTPSQEAAEKMRNDNVGSLPVCDESGKCVGIVTDRDIVCNVCAKGKEVSSTTVNECMSSPVQTCHEDESVEAAEQKMAQQQIRRLVVLNRGERLVGIVSLADIALQGSRDEAGQLLNAISHP